MLLSLALLPFLLQGSPATDPKSDDVHNAFNSLKSAEEKKDIDLIKKNAAELAVMARKVAESPKPERIDEIEPWEASVAFAKEVLPYADYSLFSAALGARGAKVV